MDSSPRSRSSSIRRRTRTPAPSVDPLERRRVAAVAAAAVRAVRRRRVRAADCLRQPREPAAGARARAAPRAGRSHRDGRGPRAPDPAADDREPAARGRRRRARRGDRRRWRFRCCTARADRAADRGDADGRPSRAAVRDRRSPSSPAWSSAWRRCCASAGVRTSAACAKARGPAAARRSGCARALVVAEIVASVVLLVSAGPADPRAADRAGHRSRLHGRRAC